jgi:predicted ATP-grasp superfamily ATP-dependent carboligase
MREVAVLDPSELYELTEPDAAAAAPTLGRPVLVHAFTGFIDAGAAGRLLRDHLLENFEHRLLASFDVDQLLDYRSRRPTMVFVENHWVSYEEPALLLHVIEDAAGVPFLLLEGAEPDVQWERFLQAVLHLVETLDVRLSIGVHGIPMGLPHTRPTGVTAHATSLDLVAGHPPWIGTVQVPGSVGNLLEYRLGQAGHDAMGFAVHVPHYLAQTDYPDAALALLDSVAKAAGLTLPGDALAEAAQRTRAEIDEQVSAAPEVVAVVESLEQQYDAYVDTRVKGNPLTGQDGSVPTGDELGAELERFLAERTRRSDPPES